MSWQYRIRKRKIGIHKEYGIVENYDKPHGYSIANMTPLFQLDIDDEGGDATAVEALRWQLTEMLKALDRPILDEEKEQP